MSLQGLALAWFRREDWPRWCEMDPDFQPDYAHWLRRIEAAEQQQVAAGVRCVRITVAPEEFLTWSREFAGGAVDSPARATYASLQLMRQDAMRERH